jgi:hypothetical protein
VNGIRASKRVPLREVPSATFNLRAKFNWPGRRPEFLPNPKRSFVAVRVEGVVSICSGKSGTNFRVGKPTRYRSVTPVPQLCDQIGAVFFNEELHERARIEVHNRHGLVSLIANHVRDRSLATWAGSSGSDGTRTSLDRSRNVALLDESLDRCRCANPGKPRNCDASFGYQHLSARSGASNPFAQICSQLRNCHFHLSIVQQGTTPCVRFGSVTIEILMARSTERLNLVAGQFVVVPRGLWHRHVDIKDLIELYFTPGDSIQSSAEDPREQAVVDLQWNVVAMNSVSAVFTSRAAAHLVKPPFNLIRLSLHAEGLAPLIVNFDEYAHHNLGRLHRLVKQQPDPTLTALLDEFGHLDTGGGTQVSNIVLPIVMRFDTGNVSLFSTITTFGTPHEVTLADLSIETFYPADPESKKLLNEEVARCKTETATETR